MAHVSVAEGMPGISGLLRQYPESAKPLTDLANVLLRDESPLTPGEREMIAAYVSSGNRCVFCHNSHAAAAMHLLDREGSDRALVGQVCTGLDSAPVSEKMRALLRIAGKVREDGKKVLPEDIAAARDAGAEDRAIHDTVLIAAAFCMYNRYVDGLGTFQPPDPADYDRMGAALAEQGYGRR
jgi:uncharacterized peroxidase-related enzyme